MKKNTFRIMMDWITFICLVLCMIGFVHIWASVRYSA